LAFTFTLRSNAAAMNVMYQFYDSMPVGTRDAIVSFLHNCFVNVKMRRIHFGRGFATTQLYDAPQIF